jgi:hypothetical protein
MRPRLTLVPITWLLLALFWSGCRRSGGSSDEHDTRWSVSPKLVIANSLQELTNVFAVANREYTWTLETTVDPDFAILSRYAHSGIRSFEVYTYEKVIDGFWHLRSVSFIHASDSMKVQVQRTNDAVQLFHDRVPLFTVQSSVRQVAEQAKSPMVRGRKAAVSDE